MKTLLLLLMPLWLFSQAWPAKDCPDRPYIKANSDTIYHTCDCGTKSNQADSLHPGQGEYWNKVVDMGTWGIQSDSVELVRKWTILRTSTTQISSVSTRTGTISKPKHPTNAFCPMCHLYLPWRHIQLRQEFGWFSKDEYNADGTPKLTEYGKWEVNHVTFSGEHTIENLKQFKKYLPKGYLSDERIRDKWWKLLFLN